MQLAGQMDLASGMANRGAPHPIPLVAIPGAVTGRVGSSGISDSVLLGARMEQDTQLGTLI